MANRAQSWLSRLGPGILLAATGVGAGDILTTGLAGSEVGLALLWAIVSGAALKFFLSEGIARWQLASGTTLLEGWASHLGAWIRWVFVIYLFLYTMSVGGALATGCGISMGGLLPIGDAETSKIVWGVIHSAIGLALAWRGSFRLFEIVMSVLTGVMFVTVVFTAIVIRPDLTALLHGLIPAVPHGAGTWVLAVVGGVGGTVTLLSYGYWIREEGRHGAEDLRLCRVDLALGNGVTAIFGISALIIGSRLQLDSKGAALAEQLAHQLANAVGSWGRPVFLLGLWGAVFSSLLGVWQSVPYMVADFWELSRPGHARATDLRQTKAYRGYLLFIATVPLVALWRPVRDIQLIYGLTAASFLPLLSLTLLILNTRRRLVGGLVNHWVVNVVLVVTLAFFSYVGGQELLDIVRR